MKISKGTLLENKEKGVVIRIIEALMDYTTGKKDYQVEIIYGNIFLPLHGQFGPGDHIWLSPLWGWEKVDQNELAGVLYGDA